MFLLFFGRLNLGFRDSGLGLRVFLFLFGEVKGTMELLFSNSKLGFRTFGEGALEAEGFPTVLRTPVSAYLLLA